MDSLTKIRTESKKVWRVIRYVTAFGLVPTLLITAKAKMDNNPEGELSTKLREDFDSLWLGSLAGEVGALATRLFFKQVAKLPDWRFVGKAREALTRPSVQRSTAVLLGTVAGGFAGFSRTSAESPSAVGNIVVGATAGGTGAAAVAIISPDHNAEHKPHSKK